MLDDVCLRCQQSGPHGCFERLRPAGPGVGRAQPQSLSLPPLCSRCRATRTGHSPMGRAALPMTRRQASPARLSLVFPAIVTSASSQCACVAFGRALEGIAHGNCGDSLIPRRRPPCSTITCSARWWTPAARAASQRASAGCLCLYRARSGCASEPLVTRGDVQWL